MDEWSTIYLQQTAQVISVVLRLPGEASLIVAGHARNGGGMRITSLFTQHRYALSLALSSGIYLI